MYMNELLIEDYFKYRIFLFLRLNISFEENRI